jgi:hypothetical protein
MKKLIFAAFMAALVYADAASAQDCALKRLASLPMTITSTGRVAVPVKINGTTRMFLVELDSSITGVNANFVDEQKLETQHIPGHIEFQYFDTEFTGGAVGHISYQAIASDFQIGGIDVKDMPLMDYPAWNSKDGIVGILGTGTLQHFDVEFDFRNAKMNLYSQDHCEGKVVYWANAYATAPLVVLTIAGKTVTQMTLDGGLLNVSLSLEPGHGSIDLWVASKVTGVPRDAFRGDDGSPPYRFKALTIGGVTIANPAIDVFGSQLCATDEALHWPPYDGYFGRCSSSMQIRRDELQKLHLYFAFKEGKLYVTAADAHK